MHRTYAHVRVAAAIIVPVAAGAMPSASIASPLRAPATWQAADSAQATSVLAGVFTADQAARGQQTFQRICTSCHTVAEHTRTKFQEKWAGTTVKDLFDIMSSTMPDGNPGSLTPEEYAGVIAFFLKETGYPEGTQELPTASAALMRIRIEPLRP